MQPIRPAERTKDVTYAIRDLAVAAGELKRQGVSDILYLNIGDPNVYDFVTPAHMIDAVDKAMRENKNGYVDSLGIAEAREALEKEYRGRGVRADRERILVTAGVSEGLELALASLVNPGENFLTPSPGYPLYTAILNKLGVKPRLYMTREEDDWQPDLQDIKTKIDKNTRGILINNPNNPTGAVYPDKTLLEILDMAREKNLLTFADEIYNKILFNGGKHTPIASLAGETPLLTFGGLSKNYLVPGWRIGWMAFTGQEKAIGDYREAVYRLARARLCAPGPFQYAIKPALEGPQDHIMTMNAKLQRRSDLVVERLNAMKGVHVTKPKGAFYVFPGIDAPISDDKGFVLDALSKEHVLVVHGTGFDWPQDEKTHIRIVTLPKEEILEGAMGRLEKRMQELYPE